MLTLVVHINFRNICFRSCHQLRKYVYNESFQIYVICACAYIVYVHALYIFFRVCWIVSLTLRT